ncbi:hypothetical protein PPL_12616 [Heterostelium album PN500]|uniref:Uncharacterized protein n=1 Tax=Heterostelium pallidum (strain ATCC 26659 / Pp 5 / PN500) TaxID=670386 RepID=D3BN38_HETP5|nr:hypothetical protein PPL_12616 [Heterostelium album PN500]EFA77400.1 hypothetical protein PPL_12616 [Heterostelium album PN500]|eukprot:XP_020429529.1 hypothetical protein PPL_12616 [Heterostelium album PN500]
MSSVVGSLENYYVALSKAVADGTKSNNQLLKFDIICNVDQLLDRMSKTELDNNASKWISLLIKSIITSLSTKQTPPNTKSALAEVLGIIFKNSKTLAIVFMSESFQLFVRLIKASEAKVGCMRAIGMMLESIGASGNPIHLECFKLIKSIYPTATNTNDFKLECLSSVVPIVKHYNNTDIKMDGLDQKILNFILKATLDVTSVVGGGSADPASNIDSPNSTNKRASELLGCLLASLFYKDNNHSTTTTTTGGIVKSNILSGQRSHWTLENCLQFIGNQFISTNKKEIKINLSIAYCQLLQNIKLLDLEKEIDSILSHLLKLLGSSNRNLSTAQDQAQTRTSVSYILRHGLGQNLSENGQQSMVRYFTNIISQADTFNELTIVVSLKELSQLLLQLGEGGIVQYDDLSTYMFSLLNDRNQSTRQWSAIGLRSLASNIPKLTYKFDTGGV